MASVTCARDRRWRRSIRRNCSREAVLIAQRCTFNLRQLAYTYPHELVPAGKTAREWLRELVETGIQARWAKANSTEHERAKARELIEKELTIIGTLHYESYFLTVHDIVRFARSRDILCQGRGSAANSAVCYALGITELQPGQMEMLFERFVSEERNEPPDIDVDFEHERREEVLQYVFERYGRGRAALAAVVIRYRGRSAVRDVARALGLPPDQVDEIAKTMDRWNSDVPMPDHLRDHGFDPESPLLRRVLAIAGDLLGFPRHLSQHPGGFVISEHPLSTLVPVENAAMDDRTVIQWDKDDLDVMKLLKVDCLALGMLTCVHKTFDLLRASGRRDIGLDDIPQGDEATYAMIRKADTVGTFQIESRAQMAMLPRLKPRVFYDLVVQVAIVRPGPIQGDMVHPYLRRRNGEDPVTYPSEALARSVQAHARRAAVPGTGDAAGDRRGRLHAGRGRPVASFDGGVEALRRHGAPSAEDHHRHVAQRIHERVRRADLRADQGLRQLRVSGIARGELRVDRVFEFAG